MERVRTHRTHFTNRDGDDATMIRKRAAGLFAALVAVAGLSLGLAGNAGAASQGSAGVSQRANASPQSEWWHEGYYMFYYECVQSGTAWLALGAKTYSCTETGPDNYPWELRVLD